MTSVVVTTRTRSGAGFTPWMMKLLPFQRRMLPGPDGWTFHEALGA
jgi:hypothetical protein